MKPELPTEYGFTLVEVLISLALLSLMTVYALGAVACLKRMNGVTEEVTAQMEVEAVTRHLRESLGDARSVFAANTDGTQVLKFSGQQNALSFITASNGLSEVGGLYEVELSVDEKSQLIETRRMFRSGQPSAAQSIVLLRGIDSIIFSYAGRSSDAPQDEWTVADQLPSGIGVDIDFKESVKGNWPTTSIEIRAAE
jgi:general secretion pathway protein J